MKKLFIAVIFASLQACAYNSTMGQDDRFQVASTASFFAPSVTTVLDTKTDSASTYAGPSIVGQVANAAGTVAGGYLLGQGIGKSGTTVSQNGGGAQSGSVSNALSSSKSTQYQGQQQGQLQGQIQGQGQTLGGHHNDGLEINH
jgi:hypothetical protein